MVLHMLTAQRVLTLVVGAPTIFEDSEVPSAVSQQLLLALSSQSMIVLLNVSHIEPYF